MPIPVYEHRIVVGHSDIDVNNHANNVCFVRWMQEAAIAHSTANGWSSQRYTELGKSWVARRHTVEYLRPALEGDCITIQTWIGSWKNVSSVRKYRFVRDSDSVVLAVAETNWVFVNTSTGRPVKIPSVVSDSFVLPECPPG
ncbi:MAG: acyl-CoA thioesterase [Planctomycetaceae bacterium]|nr:acyl-CoA thioesterase [Planctomycetaceae bacterium]